jgi:ABC-type uncharacterized transport system permease subunit
MILALVSSGLYLAAGTVPALRLVRGPEHVPGKVAMLTLGALALALHAAVVYSSALTAGGLHFHFFAAASMVGLLMAAMTLFFSIRQPAENMGILTLPLAAIAVLLGALLATPGSGAAILPAGVGLHVYTSLLAYSALAVAALHAVLLALQESRLRRRHPGGFVKLLPPLQIMESLLFQMLTLGFLLLTLSLLTGFLFLEDMFAQHLVHKTTLSLAAWLLFATLLIGHWRFGWRGQTAVRWTIGAFVVLMLAYFGSKFVLELVLHRQ